MKSIVLPLLSVLSLCTACGEDSKNIVKEEKWIGAACHCDKTAANANCDILGVPIPHGMPIVGCDNVPEIAGAQKVCLRTIPANQSTVTPETHFPKGYCGLSALGCEGNDFICNSAKYGDVAALTSCPAGSALFEGKFEYQVIGQDTKFKTKSCLKLCNDNGDCNADGEMSCLKKKGVKFCYHEKNLTIFKDNYTLKAF